MDFDQLKAGVKEISEIASSVPEPFRDKCFEVLLTALLTEYKGESRKENSEKKDPADDKDDSKDKKTPSASTVPMNAALRVLMRKTNLSKS